MIKSAYVLRFLGRVLSPYFAPPMGFCPCFDFWFKPARVPSSEESPTSRKTGKRRKAKSESESTTKHTPTAVSKLRKHQISQYRKFFQGENINQLAFTQRLSTINNDRLINFIELPLKMNLNEDTEEPASWITFRTPAEFFSSMGYRKVKELGRGGFGTVFLVEKCVPLTSGEAPPKGAKAMDEHFAYYQMACKLLMLPDYEDKSSRKQFESLRAELYMLQGLRGRCPYVIEYYEHFVLRFKKSDKTNYMMAHIMMEVADAGSMVKEVEKKGPLPTDLARRYFAEMAEGLEFLHRNQVAHNDFKLDNVLLVTNSERPKVKHCKLTDFGMSAFAWKEGVGLLYSERYQGTRHYMAPEVIRIRLLSLSPNKNHAKTKKEYVPFAADIWSLGVSLYVLLTRQFPYDPPKTADKKLLTKFLSQASRGVLKMKDAKQKFGSSKLAQLLCGMLEYDPDKRFTIATVTGHGWLQSKGRTD